MSIKDAGKYLSLSDAIQTLKGELLKAEAIATSNNAALLTLEECEIELSLEFTPKVGVGFDIHVFKADVGAEATGTHKITVKYKPIRPIVAAALAKTVENEPVLIPKKRATQNVRLKR